MASTATGSGHSAGYIVESTYGTTPATPAFTNLRLTSTSLGLSKTALESNELSSTRQVLHYRHGNKQVGGDIGFELSYGTFDDFLEAALGGTWATDTPSAGIDQLKAGLTRRSFTIERKFGDLDTPEYHRYTGCEINSMSLSVAPDAMVTGSFSMIGQDYSPGNTSIITGATYPAGTTTEPFDSFTGTIDEGGSTIGIVTALEMSLENGLNPLFVVGSDTTLEPGIGKLRASGTVTVFFQDSTMLNKFVNETASTLELTLLDPAGNEYYFHLPNIKYNGGQPDTSDDSEITLSMPFVALYDATEASAIVIERTPV